MAIAIMLNEEVVTLSPRKGTFENKFLLRHGSESGLIMNGYRSKKKKKKHWIMIRNKADLGSK